MTALLLGPINLDKVKDFLFENDIDFQEWYRDDELEIRVDLENLDEDEFNKLESEFNDKLEKNINEFTFLIFW